ncbi:MAG TPA: alpha amylase C-terminal domain-containing protein, partial [Thermoanaerobaculia bacterium]|nr:alpha amylase C-terminal domain-containing protein [Thermoanaerobaculia bacterium]
FMGGELGQWTEWAHESSLDWHLLGDERHAGLVRWIGDLNHLYRGEPALHQLDCDPAGFEWVDASDHGNSVLAFLRRGEDGDDGALLLAVFNFTPQPHHGYRFGVPRGGRWEEVLNGDGADYGGSGVGNQGAVEAVEETHQGRPFALDLTLPPLAMVVLKSASPSAPPSESTTPASTA